MGWGKFIGTAGLFGAYFEKLYNQRTSAERTFGDLKDNYNLDNIRVAKMERAKVFMDLSCIALLASRLSGAANKEKSKVA